MNRIATESSTIRSVGYDPKTRTLEIEFQSGQVYDYADIPPEVHEDLMKAESRGRYFREKIRDVYRYRRVSQAHARSR